MDAKSKEIYIPLSTIYGKPNPDGTYTLTALDIKNLNDNLYALAKMMQGGLNLANLNKATNQVFEDIDGNVTAVTATAEGLTTSVSNLNNEVSTVKQTASSLSATVTQVQQTANSASGTASSAYSKAQSVELTVDGFTVSDGYGNTTINGDKIRSGTIEGVTLISSNGAYMPTIEISNGSVFFGQDHGGFKGALAFDVSNNRVWLSTYSDTPLKIDAGLNMSIDSGGTIFIGTNSAKSGNVTIGQAGGNVNIVGNVTVNGTPIGG